MKTETFKFLSKKRIFSLWTAVSLVFLLPPSIFGQPLSTLKVMASLFPLQEFARAVGGEKVQVILLLPPGAEAHSWEPKPSDVVKITQADIFIYIGPSMEPWVDKVLKAAQGKKLRVLEASRGLSLLKAEREEQGRAIHSHGHFGPEKMDPHVWLDFTLDLKIVDEIATVFSEKDPAHAFLYKNNAETYKQKLKNLDQKYQTSLAQCRHRQILLSGHAAFAYLAKRYALQQIALSGISPDAEPTPQKMAEMIKATRKEGIKFIYSEELVHPKLSQALAKEAGVGILVLNPGHNLTPKQVREKVTFLELMEKNLKNLQRGLGCEKQ
ncbi:MAG: zinc ABC transporter substrate-binding protein [Thermodesulfobacteriota bacterium]